MSEAPLFDRAKFAGDAKLTYGTVDEYLHMLETMERLDEKGDLLMHRVDASYAPTPVSTLSGRTKAIPTIDLWQHKSCGQCGHIPGYVTALYWIMSELGVPYVDDTNQTSCTAWNYYGSGTSNPVALASVFVRNMHSAWEKDAYPLIHCGTSYGDYKEVRMLLVMNETLREQVRAILKKIGRDLVVPQELVHYSEWLHVMRAKLAERRVIDLSNITVAVHAACHTYKLLSEDYTYDDGILQGRRPAPVSSIALALGAQLADYSNWRDCCGFGFRHILTEREVSRSFAYYRKIQPIVRETHADVLLTNDTGCVTTLDKSQVVPLAHGHQETVPVISDAQFAALAMGAHPFIVCQIHWHVSDWRPLLAKMGIDADAKWAEYQDYVERVKGGMKPAFIQSPPRPPRSPQAGRPVRALPILTEGVTP
ncbi:MAG: heterodisulfide reductase subunit B [Gemmatimonadetes bacterium GWC2_71_10]|nr:MAG: heterodisulfide reductase subunit B [Gemmatimonadetes bacterium GWC2_71_10]